MKRLISIPIVCASLLACSKNNPPAATPPNPDMVTYDTTVSLDTSKNPPAQVTALAEAINGKQEVSFNSISDMIIGDHVAEYNRMEGKTLSLATVQAQISNLASKVQVSQSLGAKKVAYETALESDLGRSIDYNSSKVTLAHPLEEGRQQCYSGSMLSMVVNRKLLTGQDYRTMNFVMIYTDGHQLPGQMVFKDSTWYLTGVETTALGAAEIREVPASQISTDTLVYDAEYTALMEVFKNYISWQEGKRLAYSLRKMTSDRYGIPIPTQVDAERIAAQKLAGQRGSRFRGSNLNSSPFGIGVSKAPAGDLQRSAYVGIGTPGVLSLKAEVQGGFEGPRFPDHPGEMRNNFR
ncbi:MAG TPA: hypothetical protein DCL41_07590, partial [Bdellovibrionales bacterium]|nr:hypothetical protein [Bdellovibrionales bacterium]